MLGAYNPSQSHVIWIRKVISALTNRLEPHYGNENQLQKVSRDFIRANGRTIALRTLQDYAQSKDTSNRGPKPRIKLSTFKSSKYAGDFHPSDFSIRIETTTAAMESVKKKYPQNIAVLVDAIDIVSTIIHEAIHAIQLYPMNQYYNDKTLTEDQKNAFIRNYIVENYGDTYEINKTESPAWASDAALMMSYWLSPKYYIPDNPVEALRNYYRIWKKDAPFIGYMPMYVSGLFDKEELRKYFYKKYKEGWKYISPAYRKAIQKYRPDIFRPGGDIMKSVDAGIPYYLKNLRRFMRAYKPINDSLYGP